MNENDQQQLNELKKDIKEQSIMKKGPMIVSYLVGKGLTRITPDIVQQNSEMIIDVLYRSSAYFFTMIFPLIYVYKRDENEEDDL